jgi:hypothetical protein
MNKETRQAASGFFICLGVLFATVAAAIEFGFFVGFCLLALECIALAFIVADSRDQ